MEKRIEKSGEVEIKGLNRKVLAVVAIVVVVVVSLAVVLMLPSLSPQKPQEELGFTISGSNQPMTLVQDMVYIPFRTQPNEHWHLTIEAINFPSNAYTNLLSYNGYWDGGKDFKCTSEDLYSIADKLEHQHRFQADSSGLHEGPVYEGHFGGDDQAREYTVFFAFPNEGCTFNVKLERA